MNDGQRAHVTERLQAGASHEEMVQYLRSEGVGEETAKAGVAEVATSLQPAANNGLPSVGDLLRASWQFVTSRTDLVGWYVVVSLVPVVAVALLGVLAIAAAELAPVAMGGVLVLGFITFAATIWFTVTASAGLIYAIAQSDGEAIRFRAGWDWARPHFWQITLLGVLLGLVLMSTFMVSSVIVMMYDVIFSGGSLIFALQDVEIAGFAIMDILLFATAVSLPFVITLIVYSAFYILEFICHEQRGFHALAASTHIVYGRFWPIALRLGVMMAIIIAVNYVLTIMFGLSQKYATTATVIGEVVAMVVSFFFVVMFMRYLALLHTAAVASTTPYLREPLSQSYKTYKFITIVGAGVMVLFVLGSLLALLGFAA